jgi:hypothetical protein
LAPGSIVIRAKSLRLDEAKEFASAIEGLKLDAEIRVEEHQWSGTATTWFQILYVTLIGGAFGVGRIAGEQAVKKITDIFIDWARERFRRKSPSKRPVYLEIYAPDENGDWIAKALLINNSTDEPEDRTEQQQRLLADSRARTADAHPIEVGRRIRSIVEDPVVSLTERRKMASEAVEHFCKAVDQMRPDIAAYLRDRLDRELCFFVQHPSLDGEATSVVLQARDTLQPPEAPPCP